jgi:hypothetical protein
MITSSLSSIHEVTSAALLLATRHMNEASAVIAEAREEIQTLRQRNEALVAAAQALLIEIDLAQGLKVADGGILDPLHPICVMAEALRVAMMESLQ